MAVATSGLFRVASSGGYSLAAAHRLLTVVVSLAAELGLQARRLQELQRSGSAVVAHRLGCSTACAVFPDQESNPCPSHWQDSYPLDHEGSPPYAIAISYLAFQLPPSATPRPRSQSIFHPVSRIILSKHNAGQVAFHSGAYAGFPFHSPTI